ncbi:MAG TPA: bifunctional DNA-formamidopyrimidine glycosylase/DNA-(apurinic or apyrimidinic site) lyase [Thermomicrobiaceae bacterium]|nr:bifunctional DNA-formamidopyrimidine glycosylase/DNA-(apurinic or apyrimidinic site) lyase [Thermomicrobiaceae bacterium]
MPELPEVESVRRSLDPVVVGARVEQVRLGDFTGCIAAPDSAAFVAAVSGRTIMSTGRRAKYLLLGLDSGDTIAIHLRMTGELVIADASVPLGRHHHLTFALDDGRELRFADVRKFGRIRLLDANALSRLDQDLGPEPLDDDLTDERFAAMLAGRRRAVKPLLLDQTFLAGVGNIYADEALFAARLHPLRPAASLTSRESSRLLSAVRATLQSAIDRGGTTLRDYRDGLGRPGTNQHHLQIYALDPGEPCPRCGTPIERTVVAQRGTRYCPRCQPPPDQ